MAQCRDELEADFRQHYGLDLGRMGTDYSVAHAAVLASQLPHHSRCMAKLNPDLAISDEAEILCQLDYHLRYLMWMLSKDGAKGRNQPAPYESPTAALRRAEKITNARRNRDKVDAILGMGPS